ncbi:MAG: carboxymuconolactone decarboxylase family protein [Acidimicrobiia bacterium]
MPVRVPLYEPGPDDELANAIIARRGGWLATLDRVLLHSPPLANGWNVFYGAIREDTEVSDRHRELAMLRVAHINGDRHNWWHHEKIARAIGMTDTEIDGIRNWPDANCFDPTEGAVLDYAQTMTVDRYVPEELFKRIRDLFSTRQVVELTAIIASYNCVNRFLVAMDIDSEIDFHD